MADDPKLSTPRQAERIVAAAAHLVPLLGYLIPVGNFVIANVLAPLGMWLGMGKHSAHVEQHTREATNVQITLSILLALDNLLFEGGVRHIGVFLLVVLYALFAGVFAAFKAYRGTSHKYALSLRFLR